MRESYGSFARVYDELMDNVPYEEWAEFLINTLKEYGVGQAGEVNKSGKTCGDKKQDETEKNLAAERNTVLDLGCGTGTLTGMLWKAGFDMIGIDNSEEMLEVAMEKQAGNGGEILYLLQDMREFELYGTVGAVYSVCDSLNYILKDEDMVQVFSLVHNYLYPGGVFVFDFNTVYKYEKVIGDAVIAENREDCSFIWENWYHDKEQINEYDLTIFMRETEDTGGGFEGQGVPYRAFRETHYQRGYTLSRMKDFLAEAGLLFIRALDADTRGEVREESERIYVIAKENRKVKNGRLYGKGDRGERVAQDICGDDKKDRGDGKRGA